VTDGCDQLLVLQEGLLVVGEPLLVVDAGAVLVLDVGVVEDEAPQADEGDQRAGADHARRAAQAAAAGASAGA
jgi:hypothetical protein